MHLPMKFEAVWPVAMGHHILKIGGEIDDLNRIEGTFLWTDTAPNAKSL